MYRTTLHEGNICDLKLRLIYERTIDGRIYNQSTVFEVVALIVGDFNSSSKRDIILHNTKWTTTEN